MRDLIIGSIPPQMFRNPFFVMVAIVVANVVFLLMYLHRHMPRKVASLYDKLLFWFDSLGLAAFTVDGVMAGIAMGYEDNEFLICFLGFMTAVGGGALRDVLAGQTPDIFRKHVYAVAAIAGAMLMVALLRLFGSEQIAMLGGFLLVPVLRFLAAHFRWNLPKVCRAPDRGTAFFSPSAGCENRRIALSLEQKCNHRQEDTFLALFKRRDFRYT